MNVDEFVKSITDDVNFSLNDNTKDPFVDDREAVFFGTSVQDVRDDQDTDGDKDIWGNNGADAAADDDDDDDDDGCRCPFCGDIIKVEKLVTFV